MIGTEQERDALERILAVLKPILTDHNPPIAIDWVGKGAIAVGQEFESAINAVREHKDDATIRAMLAPDDAVVIGENVINDDGEPEGYDRYKLADALYNGRGWELKDLGLALVRVLRGEATRDE